jgi:hypothetical protein
MRSIYAQFMDERAQAGQADKPVKLDEVYSWAAQRDLWKPPKIDPSQRFRRDMARALREDYFKDAKGRNIRRYHAAKYLHVDGFGVAVQEVFWADMLSEPPPPRDHMEVALKQRREQVVGDCYQLKNDVEFYNARKPPKEPIRMLWDFTDDLAERDMPTDYDPSDDEV